MAHFTSWQQCLYLLIYVMKKIVLVIVLCIIGISIAWCWKTKEEIINKQMQNLTWLTEWQLIDIKREFEASRYEVEEEMIETNLQYQKKINNIKLIEDKLYMEISKRRAKVQEERKYTEEDMGLIVNQLQ